MALGDPSASLEVSTEAIAKELEWGEVLVSMRASPINPGDLYNVRMGSTPYTVRGRRRSACFAAVLARSHPLTASARRRRATR